MKSCKKPTRFAMMNALSPERIANKLRSIGVTVDIEVRLGTINSSCETWPWPFLTLESSRRISGIQRISNECICLRAHILLRKSAQFVLRGNNCYLNASACRDGPGEILNLIYFAGFILSARIDNAWNIRE